MYTKAYKNSINGGKIKVIENMAGIQTCIHLREDTQLSIPNIKF